ncbi:MAG TPA: hypothetical protein VIK72_16855 [Clostridiaceae bacterium]
METSVGLSIKEVVTGYVGTESEVITNTVIETRKSSYRKDIKYERFERGITYWDSNRTPVFENDEMKYIMFTTSESTEGVLKNESIVRQHKIIAQQKQQLELQNRQLEARKLIYQSEQLIDLGDSFNTTKYFDMEGNKILYENLPGIRALNGERVENVKIFVINPKKEYYMNNSTIPIYNTSGDLTLVVSCFHDITDIIQQSKKIEEQKKELEAIIENISDGISAFDNKGRYMI